MSEFDPFSPDVQAEIVEMNNRLAEIEDQLVRIMQNRIAHRLSLAREMLFMSTLEIRREIEHLEGPF